MERTTPSGFRIADELCHQGLGFEAMFDVFHYAPLTEDEVRRRWFLSPKTTEVPGGTVTELVGYDQTPFFKMEKLTTAKELTLRSGDVFSGLYILSGSGTLAANGVAQPCGQGDQFFLPAAAQTATLRAEAGAPLTALRFYGAQPPDA